jgi:hypothetical protein
MSADIHTKGFVDESTFGALKQLINILTPEQIKNRDFNPWVAGEKELPEYTRDWLNSHYYYIRLSQSHQAEDC